MTGLTNNADPLIKAAAEVAVAFDSGLAVETAAELDAGSTIESVADIVTRGAAELGVALSLDAAAAFNKYYEYLTSYGKDVNLTAIKGANDVARLHFLDSIALVGAAKLHNVSLIDIGSGAGFPGLPLKIIDNTINLTLLDATSKRVEFMSRLSRLLGIETQCIHARAEEAGRGELRESFDIAVSRAVARLNVLCELCLPFVAVGGVFMAMKSNEYEAELEASRDIIASLGAVYDHVYEYSIPGTDIKRSVVVIRKTAATLSEYPRRFSKIIKSAV